MAIEEKHNPMAKAVLQNKIFKQKSHGKNAKVYDRKKEKKMSLKEKIMARIEESKYSSWSEGQIEAEIQKLYRTINATGDEYLEYEVTALQQELELRRQKHEAAKKATIQRMAGELLKKKS
jgi:hypothetical protein